MGFDYKGSYVKNLVLMFVGLLSAFNSNAFPVEEIYNQLDITSFNSSLFQKSTGGEKHFSQLDLPEPSFKDNSFLIESEYWKYEIKLLKVDESGIHACFLDKALWGTYNAQSPLLIRKYGNYYVAIDLDTDICKKFAK